MLTTPHTLTVAVLQYAEEYRAASARGDILRQAELTTNIVRRIESNDFDDATTGTGIVNAWRPGQPNDPEWTRPAPTDAPMFEVVGAGTYDAATDALDVHPVHHDRPTQATGAFDPIVYAHTNHDH